MQLFGTKIVGLCLGVLLLAAAPSAAASGFVSPAGWFWAKIDYSFWTADERYAGPFNAADLSFDGGREVGERVPLKLDVPGARFTSESIALSLQYVPLQRLVVGGYFPVFQRSELDQNTIAVTTEGTGDVRLYTGYQLTPPGLDVGTTVLAHVKIPTTDVSFEDLSVPLSEGQVDVGLEQVTTWAAHPRFHISGRLLYRVRFEVEQQVGNATARFKPGNETEIGLELSGAAASWLWLRATYTGLFAQARQDRSIANDFRAVEQRELHELEAGAYFQFGRFIGGGLDGIALDLWFRHPVAGADYLVGPSFGVGLAYGVQTRRLD